MKTRLMGLLLLAITATGARAAMEEAWEESYRHEATGQFTLALKALQPVLSKYPRHEFALLRTGWLNYLLGKHNDAVESYKQALAVNSKSLDARLGMTLPLLAQQRWREAAYHARQVLEIAPWNYYAHVRLMMCEEAEGQWEALAKHAAEVTVRYPSDATVQVYLARAYARLGKESQARIVFEEVLERFPRHLEAKQYLQQGAR
jgi:tetratricopeptide (TPR) repeat protein